MSEPLALLADAYNGAIILAWLFSLWRASAPRRRTLIQRLGLGLVATYTWLLVDNHWGIWPSVGADFSTHSAFAVSWVLALWGQAYSRLWLASLPLYGALMAYLGYHSPLDMLSSVAAQLALWWLLAQALRLICREANRP